jgi:hypothetical protein
MAESSLFCVCCDVHTARFLSETSDSWAVRWTGIRPQLLWNCESSLRNSFEFIVGLVFSFSYDTVSDRNPCRSSCRPLAGSTTAMEEDPTPTAATDSSKKIMVRDAENIILHEGSAKTVRLFESQYPTTCDGIFSCVASESFCFS